MHKAWWEISWSNYLDAIADCCKACSDYLGMQQSSRRAATEHVLIVWPWSSWLFCLDGLSFPFSSDPFFFACSRFRSFFTSPRWGWHGWLLINLLFSTFLLGFALADSFVSTSFLHSIIIFFFITSFIQALACTCHLLLGTSSLHEGGLTFELLLHASSFRRQGLVCWRMLHACFGYCLTSLQCSTRNQRHQSSHKVKTSHHGLWIAASSSLSLSLNFATDVMAGMLRLQQPPLELDNPNKASAKQNKTSHQTWRAYKQQKHETSDLTNFLTGAVRLTSKEILPDRIASNAATYEAPLAREELHFARCHLCNVPQMPYALASWPAQAGRNNALCSQLQHHQHYLQDDSCLAHHNSI